MKVVINKCYGGFGLSPRAVVRIAEIQGRPCFLSQHKLIDGKFVDIPSTLEELEGGEYFIFNAHDVPFEEVQDHQIADWASASMEERKASNEWSAAHSLDTGSSIDRSDPALIQAVEELGDKASGNYGKLKIVEIPDGTNYEIDEYDGMESIHEVHKSWG